MAMIVLARDNTTARISTAGGSVMGLSVGEVPLLRPARDDAAAIDSACYPLVPFGNRIRGNTFRFGGDVYCLSPNTDWDRHYLHGEGWRDEWSVEEQTDDSLSMTHAHDASCMPYAYMSRQRFLLTDSGMELYLSVTNTGERPMPFGLGWHPYFPMTPLTTLQTQTGKMWTEEEGWLPGAPVALPPELDFSTPRGLPAHWVNNAFENWSGSAVVSWPERGTALRITADPIFSTMFLFVSDTAFDPSYASDFFALEPMSHLPDGHNQPDLGGLTVLHPGETLQGAMRLELESA